MSRDVFFLFIYIERYYAVTIDFQIINENAIKVYGILLNTSKDREWRREL